MIALLLQRWGVILLPALAAGIASILTVRRDRAVLAFACMALGAHAWLYWPFTVDDAYITFRFARSWINGLGPVFQAGPRVEGFTSFGWLGLLAMAGRLGVPIEPAAKVLGVLAAAATLPAVHALALRMTGRPRLAAAAALMLALNPLFAAWSVAGMETPLFAMLVTWGVLARLEDRRVAGLPLDALLFGLSVWVRPEGFLVGSLVWLALLASRAPGSLRAARTWALAATAIALPFWAWRWSYYGAFFPNTFYAKMPDLSVRLRAGGGSLRDFALEMGPWTWLPLAASLARLRPANAPERLAWLLLVAFLAYVGWTGGDVLHLRFYVHVLPLLAVMWAAGLATLLAPLDRTQRAPAPAPAKRASRRPVAPVLRAAAPLALRIAVAVLLVAVAAGLGAYGYAHAVGNRRQFGAGYVVNNARNVQEVNLPLGEWLHAHAAPGMQLATWDIGGIGWSSGLPILDLYGLTDPTIAHLIHAGAPADRRIAYVMRVHPELIATYAVPGGPVWSWLEPASDSILAGYHYHSLWRASAGTYGLVLLARNDVSLPRVEGADDAPTASH